MQFTQRDKQKDLVAKRKEFSKFELKFHVEQFENKVLDAMNYSCANNGPGFSVAAQIRVGLKKAFSAFVPQQVFLLRVLQRLAKNLLTLNQLPLPSKSGFKAVAATREPGVRLQITRIDSHRIIFSCG